MGKPKTPKPKTQETDLETGRRLQETSILRDFGVLGFRVSGLGLRDFGVCGGLLSGSGCKVRSVLLNPTTTILMPFR